MSSTNEPAEPTEAEEPTEAAEPTERGEPTAAVERTLVGPSLLRRESRSECEATWFNRYRHRKKLD